VASGRILFTSESVSEGHPDKLADRISDAILDSLLAQDPMSRVACENVGHDRPLRACRHEITSKAHVDFQQVARDAMQDVGYLDAKWGIGWDTCSVARRAAQPKPRHCDGRE